MKKYSLTRRDILNEAYERCFNEMYAKATPPFENVDEYIKKLKEDPVAAAEEEKSPLYKRHYLSHDELKYIVNKYEEAYNIKSEFHDDCDILIRDMENKAPVDKYIDDYVDEYGNHHPGYRGYEERPPMKDRIKNKLDELIDKGKLSSISFEDKEDVSGVLAEMFKEFILERRNFYRFDGDRSSFEVSVYLGASPTSNKNDVIEYWKNKGVDVNITDRDPEKLWYYDNGWSEEEIAEEFGEENDDGDNC